MAWLFDAATDKILVASGWTGSAATILLWVKRSSGTANGHGNNPFRAWSNAAGGGSTVAGLDVQGASRNTVISFDSAFSNVVGGDVRDGAWHPVGLVMNGTAWALFYGTDPTALTKVTGTKANATSPGSFTLSDSSPDWFDGSLACVKLFGRALSDPEVSSELSTYAQVSGTSLLFRATLSTSSNTPETGTTMTAGGTAVTVVSGPAALDPDTGALAGATGGLVAGALAGNLVDQGALAGTTGGAVAGALAGRLTDQGALAGTTSPAAGALAGSPVDQGAVAGTVASTHGALTGTVADLGGFQGGTPFPTAALSGKVAIPAVLAGTTRLPVSTLAGTHPSLGTLAGHTRMPVSTMREVTTLAPGEWRPGVPTLEAPWSSDPTAAFFDPVWHAGTPA